MKKSGYRKVLAALLALLLAVPGSWAAFATETYPVEIYDEAADPVDGGIDVADYNVALSVNAEYENAGIVVNGDVSLEGSSSYNPTAVRAQSGEGLNATATVNGDVNATNTGTNSSGKISGVRVSGEGENRVYIYGDMVVTAEELMAMGIDVSKLDGGLASVLSRNGESEGLEEENAVGASNSVTMSGDLIVTSDNNNAIGIGDTDKQTPGNLQIDIGGNLKVSGTNGTGITMISPNSDGEPLEKDVVIGGGVDVTGTAGGAEGIILEGNQTAKVDIAGDLTVTGNPDPQSTDHSYDHAVGLVAMGGDNTVSIGGNVNVTGEGNSMGILGEGGNNTLTIGGDVTAEGGVNAIGVGAGISEDGKAEISVGGSVSAVSTGTESGSQAIGLGVDGNGTAMVDITGDVTATIQGAQDDATGVMTQGSGDATLNIGGGVTATGDYATGVNTVIYEKPAEGDEGTRDAGTVAVNITGDVTADGGLNATGVYAEMPSEGDLTVNIGGAVSANAEGDDEHGAVAGLELFTMGGNITATVGEGVTAESGSANATGIGIYAYNDSTVNVTVENGGVTSNGAEDYYSSGVEIRNNGAQVQVDVTGDVESNGTGIVAYGNNPDTENPAVTSVHVDGNVTSTGTDFQAIYADVSDETYAITDETERIENNSQVEILVEGDVTAEDTAVWIDADTTVGTVDLTVDGTVSGGEHSIVLSNEANLDQVTVTVWEVKPNDAGALVERAEVNRDTGDTVYTQDAEAEKQIQYIIRIAQPEYISTEGTTDSNGYQVAHEGDTVFVKLNIPEGFTLDSVWRDAGQTLNVVRNAMGEYYLAVPRGGGVELSVTLREIVTEPAERPLTITMDPNGGTINGKEGILLIAAYDGRIFTLPAAPEKEGAEFLGWFATPYAKEDSRWVEPAADSKELKQAGQKDKITHNVFYTAIWGEPAAEKAGEAAPAEAAEVAETEAAEQETVPETETTEPAEAEATEPEAEGGAEG